MALPTLFDVVSRFVLAPVIGLTLVHLVSKALKLRSKPIVIADARKEATLALLVTVTTFVGVSVWRVLTEAVFSPTFGKSQPLVSTRMIDVLWMAFLYVLVLPPLFLAMKRTGQNLGSIGIEGTDIVRMLALGFILSAIQFAILGFLVPFSGGGFAGFSPSLIYGLLFFTIVGFGEEIIWRGYVQTRLIAYGGKIKGYLVTSLFFAVLWHFPGAYYRYSGVISEALVSSLLIFPIGVIFGYLMIRSQNIIPPSIFHLFWDWNVFFWQIPSF